ncbi:hypothetical protein HHK36_026651 [Tetracentron sinense]|uniref:Pentatricopeptide repeat-containing protein n=1 Tax=Tetracentron sinense TaxID=13715 RepID=A0A834YH85_TETSI|nr:hypothetical protein HHK36_026651 [Tetracentron sinense]
METPNILRKLRYISKRNSLYSIFFQCQSPKTLISIKNPSSSLPDTRKNPNSDCNSHLLCKNSFISSISISSVTSSSSQSPDSMVFSRNTSSRFIYRYLISNFDSLPPHSLFRSFSVSSSDVSSSSTSLETRVSIEEFDFEKSRSCDSDGPQSSRSHRARVHHRKLNVNPQKMVEIIGLIKRGENGLESKLNQMDVRLSLASIREIFQVLNSDGVSALPFFNWVRETHPNTDRNSEICSMIINNLIRLENYEKMLILLKDFKSKQICLTEKAFGSLLIYSSNGVSIRDSIKRVIELLNKAGGSCRSSGIHSLIKMLCISNSFDLAIFVMGETVKKTSYYNVLIWAKCQHGDFQEARDLIEEMRSFSCHPNANTYNYLLGSLCQNGKTAEACKLLEEMQEQGYLPDAVTFEILIYYSCRLGRSDFATKFLNQMMSSGLEPRLTTHAAFIKGYFNSKQYQEAHKYVVDMGVKFKCSSNTNYSLLASLHQKEGSVVKALEVLVEMIKKDIKPNFPVYMRVLKDLHKSGNGHLAADLKSRFSRFHSSMGTE